MKGGKLLTVVVPVYKVEPYIDKCLSSLVLRNPVLMEALEVLIVNDGTLDNSAEMSREYVKRYPGTFRQIDKENGGHGSAWNVGLEEATGKYLRFLDSDDWLTDLDRLIGDLEDCDADIVFNPFVKEYLDNGQSVIVDTLPARGVSRIDPEEWGTSGWGYDNVNFWSATYKTAILKPLQPLFAEKTSFDDYIITWAPLVHGRTYMCLDYPVYHYLLGRSGQSISALQQRNCAVSYVRCFRQYESVRDRIDVQTVPSDLLSGIDNAIVWYAGLIFPSLIYLPLGDALKEMAFLWKTYLARMPHKTKLLKRYADLPGVAYYYVEHLRRVIKRI